MLNIQFSYDKEFVECLDRIKSKYGEEVFEQTGIGKKELDFDHFSRTFYNKKSTQSVADIVVDSNANVSEGSVIAYAVEGFKPHLRLNSIYLMWKYSKKRNGLEFANQVVESEICGRHYTHDLHLYGTCPYCYAFSAFDLVNEGLPFITKINSRRAKHYDTFIEHCVQAIVYYSNSIAGAVALPDWLACLSYFIEQDVKSGYLNGTPEEIDRKIEQGFQIFVYSISQPFRGGMQSPFTNISIMDYPFMKNLFDSYVFPDGSKLNYDNLMKIQQHFIRWFNKEWHTNVFTFPVLTACISIDDNKREVLDPEFLDWIAEENLEWGFLNFYVGPLGNLSSCCRLRNNLKEANQYMNSFGASGLQIGSHRVVTLNLPHMALELRNNQNIDKSSPNFREAFNDMMDKYLASASDILITHRKIMEKRIKQGVLPLYTLNLMNLRKQFSTIGIVGIYEMLQILGLDMECEEGKDFVDKMIDRISLHNKEMKLKTGYLWNTEQVPAENVAIKLAKKDRYIFGEEKGFEIYSNQFYPLTLDVPMIERIITQGRFDSKLDGGSIMHLSLNDRVRSKEQMKKLILACKDAGVCYFAVNHQINKCDNEHTTIGKNGDHCSVCGSDKLDKFTRVVGFFTNVSSWHKVRREEFKNRAFYKNGSQQVQFENELVKVAHMQ